MKQGLNPRRSRGRGNPRGRHPNTGNRNHQLDSNGPEGRIRGSAAQILERYLALARDAQSSGDTVAAENLFQHAEHYFRLLNANGANGQNHRPRPAEADHVRDDYEETESTEEQGRLNGDAGEGWRQPRARDDDRNRQVSAEPQRQRDAAPSPVPAEAGSADSRPVTGTGEASADADRRANRRSGDLGDHRPAFLRRRLPPSATRQEPAPASRADESAVQTDSAAPVEAAAQAVGPAQVEASTPAELPASVEGPATGATAQTDEAPAGAAEEKPKPRTRRRRTTSEGEEPVRAPRRRANTKRAAEEERADSAEGRDLETSA